MLKVLYMGPLVAVILKHGIIPLFSKTKSCCETYTLFVNFGEKILSLAQLPVWRANQRAAGRRLVATNGCFDILHVGHVMYLQAARKLGDGLIVGLNGDSSVRRLKGLTRPVNTELDRAIMLAALESVTALCVFHESTATDFLSLAQPDIYVKGSDYTIETINQEERNMVESSGGKILFLPLVPGKSTTGLMERICRIDVRA